MELTHSSVSKAHIKNSIYSYIYEPMWRHYSHRLGQLIDRNMAMGGYTHRHFVYKGIVYNMDNTQPPLRKNRLVEALREPMDTYLREVDHINKVEIPYVVGFITKVLNSSDSLTDYLKVFPDAIHAPIQQLIAKCPCRATRLSDETVQEIVTEGKQTTDLIKQRLMFNLLL